MPLLLRRISGAWVGGCPRLGAERACILLARHAASAPVFHPCVPSLVLVAVSPSPPFLTCAPRFTLMLWQKRLHLGVTEMLDQTVSV